MGRHLRPRGAVAPAILPVVVGAFVMVYLLQGRLAPAPAAAGLDPAAYVRQLYRDLAGRDPTAAELDTIPLPDATGAGRTASARAVLSSAAVSARRVDGEFAALLRRAPGPAERSRWTAMLVSGAPLETLTRSLVASDEYLRVRAGGAPDRFVAELSADLTGAAPTAATMTRLLDALRAGAPRERIVAMVADGDERIAHLVDVDYELALHRHADPGGAAAYAAGLRRGWSSEDVLVSLLGSDEYLHRAEGTHP